MDHNSQTSDVLQQVASGSEPADPLVLRDGTLLSLRPVSAGDRDRVATLFARLSPESRRRRFLSPKPELSSRELAYLTQIDHVDHEAFAAVDPRDGSIVGVARYVAYADRWKVVELAIEVADELQRMGIGTALVRRTIERARAHGFAVMTATTQWENRPARALLRRFGFRARASGGSEIELELELDTPSVQADSGRRPRTAAPTHHRTSSDVPEPARRGASGEPTSQRTAT